MSEINFGYEQGRRNAPNKEIFPMIDHELNNIQICDLGSVLMRNTLPESYWQLIDNAKETCSKLIMSGIKDSNHLFRLFDDNNEVELLSTKYNIGIDYMKKLYSLLKFHSYKPFQLKKLQSIDPAHSKSLSLVNVKTNGDLLTKCTSHNDRSSIVNICKIPDSQLNALLSISDLIRKPGIKEIKALLFIKLGVRSLYELSQKNPIEFRSEIKNKIGNENMDRAIPTEKEINSDIAWARILPRIIDI